MIVVVASANPDKVAEVRTILTVVAPRLELRARPPGLPDVDETGETLEDNARLKAEAVASATGLVALADDTGLEVAALGGAPGVRTARFAGERASYADNVAKLLAELDGVADRAARFRTAVVVRWPDGRELVAEGSVDGRIAVVARGRSGFGYDPVFEPDGGGGQTFAELGPSAKHQLSHRGRALQAIAARLAAGD